MEKAGIESLLDNLSRHLKTKDGKDLPDSQRAVLYACLNDKNPPYKAMSDQLRQQGYGQYNPSTLRNDGYLVFKRLTNALGDDIKKKNCHRKLLDWYSRQRKLGDRTPVKPTAPFPPVPNPSHRLQFAGWQNDLDRLSEAIATGQRVVYIGGPVRIGKSHFTQALVEQIQADFDTVVWCQAMDVPTVNHLYQSVVDRLRQDQKRLVPVPSTLSDSAIPALLELLKSHRILLVVDYTEVLYCSQQLAGKFRPESTEYEQWLRRLLELTTCQGCLLWVGQEPPACFDVQYGILAWHRVEGLTMNDAAMLLDKRKLSLNAIADWSKLVTFCGGNPAWLLMQSALVKRSHTAHIQQFLTNPSIPPNATDLLHRSLTELSQTELVVLAWLLSVPLTFQQVRRLESPNILPSDWEEALTSLNRRSLVERDVKQRYQIVPPLLQYVLAEHIVNSITAELTNHSSETMLDKLRRYPLFHGGASAQRQSWQRQHLLKPIAAGFQRQYGFRHEQSEQFHALLTLIRQQPTTQQGYAVGNLLNVAIALHLPLKKLDFSGLTIRHCDLRQAILTQANFNHCRLQHTLLPLNLTGPLMADMTPDGEAIAIGDGSGAIYYWQRAGESFRLAEFDQLPEPIDQLLFQDPYTLMVVSNQTLYQWWLGGDQGLPEPLTVLPAPVNALTSCQSGYTALGLTNGQIVLWNDMGYHPTVLEGHKSSVCGLAFNADSRALVSLGMDNQGLVWNLDMTSPASTPDQALPSSLNMCLAVSWAEDRPLRAEQGESRIHLRMGMADMQEQAMEQHHFDSRIAPEELIALKFSANGHYLAGSTVGDGNGSQIFCWDWRTDTLHTMSLPHGYAQVLAVCNRGWWLLVRQDQAIQLVDLHQQALIWQVETGASNPTAIGLETVQGLNLAQQKLLGIDPDRMDPASNVISLEKRSMDSSTTTTMDSLG